MKQPGRLASALHVIDNLVARCENRPAVWLMVITGFLAIQVSPWWYPTGNGLRYLSIARSLANGQGIAAFGVPHPSASIGYPVLISPAFLLDDRPFLLLSALHALLAVVCMFGVYHWARRQFPSLALLITALAMLNIAVWIHYRRTLKEIAFMAIVVWAANALEALRSKRSVRQGIALWIFAVLLVICAVVVRYTGIVLAAGFATALLCQAWRQKSDWMRVTGIVAAICLAGGAAALGCMQYESTTSDQFGGATYAGTFLKCVTNPGLADRLLEALRLRISSIGQITVPGMYKSYAGPGEWLNVNTIVFCAWMVVVATGWWHLACQRFDVLTLSFPFYLGLYLLWPFDVAARFFVSMAPLLMACVTVCIARLSPRYRSIVALLLFAHLGVAFGYWVSRDAPRARRAHAQWTNVDQLAAIIQEDRDAVAVSDEVNRNFRVMLGYALNRDVHVIDAKASASEKIDWLVVPREDAGREGFSPRKTTDKCVLLSRGRAAESGSAAMDRRPNRSRR